PGAAEVEAIQRASGTRPGARPGAQSTARHASNCKDHLAVERTQGATNLLLIPFCYGRSSTALRPQNRALTKCGLKSIIKVKPCWFASVTQHLIATWMP